MRASRRAVSATPALLALVFALASAGACGTAIAQSLSDLEPERPLLMEDASPVAYRAVSGSVDWTYALRTGSLNDYGPGFSVRYGAARGLEAGAAIRWVTRPERNADRGIASGDLMLHALYQVLDETAARPAIAFRAGVQFPTGLASKGTDLQLALLGTRTFDAFRLNANVSYVRLGATNSHERHDAVDGIVGIDFLPPNRRGLTDTLILSDVAVRSNPVIGGNLVVTVEAGARQRIGSQTILFAGAGSDVTGMHDRARLRLRIGLTHSY